MSFKTKKSFGQWDSPITPAMVAKASNVLSEVRSTGDAIYWLERRAEEAGRQVIVRLTKDQKETITPEGWRIGTRVHEYGGGHYVVAEDWIYFANDADQRWYRQKVGKMPEPMTPEPPAAKAWRYADAVVTPDRAWLIAVREKHESNGVVNDLVAIATDGSLQMKTLVTGADFYASPCVSDDGKWLAWLSWSHPNMPWDGTTLWCAALKSDLTLGLARPIAGGDQESIYQPTFGPHQKLYFCSDATGFWNIYCYDHQSVESLLSASADFGYPQWVFGTNIYAILDDQTVVAIKTEKAQQQLGRIQNNEWIPFNLPFNTLSPALAIHQKNIIFIGANSREFSAVRSLHLDNQSCVTLQETASLKINQKYLSTPQLIEFHSENHLAYGFYYPPYNEDFESLPTEKPPLIVQAHGGPTAAVNTELNLKIQFWTSRGFAVLEVNYVGSTGYGRAYRELLKQQWGIADVADCMNGAKYLVAAGKADPNRLAIRGSSAGGFTVLCALTFHDLFTVGISYYGVADLESLLTETHKFESHYLEKLIGKYPEQKSLYESRSPLHHANQLKRPILFLQGLADKVVSPSQAESIIKIMKKNQIPYEYVTFLEEQHGFKSAETIKIALESELAFYQKFL